MFAVIALSATAMLWLRARTVEGSKPSVLTPSIDTSADATPPYGVELENGQGKAVRLVPGTMPAGHPNAVAAPLSSARDVGDHARDGSGLTHEEKIDLLLEAHALFRDAHESSDLRQCVTREAWLARRCAVTILRERGQVQYEPDIAIDGRQGFKGNTENDNEWVIVMDNGKYVVGEAHFPVLDLAHQRAAHVHEADLLVDQLSSQEVRRYDQFVEQALLALGVETLEFNEGK